MKRRMTKIYIAGPITGCAGYETMFAEAEQRLRHIGFIPVNPARNTAANYKGYLDKGLHQLMDCDAIYLLPGWEKSKGAALEQHYAQAAGLKIIYAAPVQEASNT